MNSGAVRPFAAPTVPSSRLPGASPVPSGGAPQGGVLEDPLSDALCPDGMTLVDGTTCAEPTHRCALDDVAHPGRCVRFEPARCRTGLGFRFCVDRHEYPNREGVLPAVMITFQMAKAACTEEGKRLCKSTEWTFACEGPRGFAFPYGDESDAGLCNVGRPAVRVRPEELWEPRDVSPTVSRLDARVASGSMSACTSPFGVKDTTGNVEEWVESDAPGGESALRGGDYTAFSPTCRALREIRTPDFRLFNTGFRCCSDPLVRAPHRGQGQTRPY